jgi:hypothetical protein
MITALINLPAQICVLSIFLGLVLWLFLWAYDDIGRH